MKNTISRRNTLKLAVAGLASGAIGCTSRVGSKHTENNVLKGSSKDEWDITHDRIWIGGNYWANPMEDWQIKEGRAECLSTGGNRSIHSLIHQIVDTNSAFKLSVTIQRAELGSNDGGGGLRVGIRSDINEYKSNCFVQKGLDAGIVHNSLVLGEKQVPLAKQIDLREVNLTLSGSPRYGAMALKLEARTTDTDELLASLVELASTDKILGNIAVVSNFSVSSKKSKLPNGSRYRFSNWQIQGEAISHLPEQKFGPILWTMYTLSDARNEQGFVMKLSAFTGPLGAKDNKELTLEVKKENGWQVVEKASLDSDAWVATFSVANWNEKNNTPYRVSYLEKHRDGSESLDTYQGIIRANPSNRPLRMAALTCQNDYAFPYEPVANNVVAMDPDLVFFSGDQIYETHGGFGIIRTPAELAILNYLRKYYQFGWAFREAMRNAPTVVLPDDHDVLQGNLWGEGGAAMNAENVEVEGADKRGGYIEPIRMVNAVHRTHTAHHPDPAEKQATPRGMTVYYTDMVYGNVNFAILADRQWKSGPEQLDIIVGTTGQGEDPAYVNPNYDREDLQLLGERQEKFLARWAKDWRGHTLKAVLSQTVFSGIATHQPNPKNYIKYDFDSSGWPATARNRAVSIMRESKALHICGDTHLASLSQYGVDSQRDSNWAFCTPAISAGWPRWWNPDGIGLKVNNRPNHDLAQTGEYLDSFGNKSYVYAVENPIVSKASNRYIKAHEKCSGFGYIEFDTEALTYKVAAYRFLIDVKDGNPNNQFSGWPVTIHKDENIGKNRIS